MSTNKSTNKRKATTQPEGKAAKKKLKTENSTAQQPLTTLQSIFGKAETAIKSHLAAEQDRVSSRRGQRVLKASELLREKKKLEARLQEIERSLEGKDAAIDEDWDACKEILRLTTDTNSFFRAISNLTVGGWTAWLDCEGSWSRVLNLVKEQFSGNIDKARPYLKYSGNNRQLIESALQIYPWIRLERNQVRFEYKGNLNWRWTRKGDFTARSFVGDSPVDWSLVKGALTSDYSMSVAGIDGRMVSELPDSSWAIAKSIYLFSPTKELLMACLERTVLGSVLAKPLLNHLASFCEVS
jgi:hypothetical protein